VHRSAGPGHLEEFDAQLLPVGKSHRRQVGQPDTVGSQPDDCVAHVAIRCAVLFEAGLEPVDPQCAQIVVGQPAGRKCPGPQELDLLTLRSLIAIANRFRDSYLTGIMRWA
jgi:hypothetical protein